MGTWMSGAAAIYWTFLISYTYGGCEFPKQWAGWWFQSGVPQPLPINSTYIETKGECYEEQGDKYLVYDRADNCYRCMAIHVKHSSVLQYKETFCESKASLQEICYGITGDASLYSMFRKSPEAKPVPCPFKSAPFTFSYNRGSGDCKDPPSKAESCTDDSRLVLKYQACLDDPSTETHVEELVCLATWKEGSTRYLIGKISQGNRRALTSDEDQYRCFIYLKSTDKGKVVYHIAQSGDASCNGLQSVHEGSRTMKFTAVDNHHNRCKFPTWITDHHTWLSLDHKKTYKFSQRNATLKILDEEPKLGRNSQQTQQPQQHFAFQEFGFVSQDQHRQNSEMRVICHAILESKEQKKVQIVAHITAGCDSGYVCMVFYKRDSHVIEIQQSEDYHDNPDDACNSFDPTTTPFTTLITTTLHPKKCPNVGRFTLLENLPMTGERRKRRQQQETGLESMPNAPIAPECLTPKYEALSVGCNSNELMEFKTACLQQPTNAFTCHGSWQDNNTFYVITSPTSRKSADTLRYCFIYTVTHQDGGTPSTSVAGVPQGSKPPTGGGPPILRLSAISESCHRHISPGIDGAWAFNFTSNGKFESCAEVETESAASALLPSFIILVTLSWITAVILR